MKKYLALTLLLGLLTLLLAVPALAETCSVYVDPVTGNIVQTCFGDGGDTCGEDCQPAPPLDCEPGETLIISEYWPNPADPRVCQLVTRAVDRCTGAVLWLNVDYDQEIHDCMTEVAENPCDEFVWSGGSFTCRKYCDAGWNWGVSTQLGFPQIFLDVRPFPATLVRWPTAMRASLIPPAQATNQLAYAPLGGGSPDDPDLGDWKDVRLTLRLLPATGFLLVELPQLGSISLPMIGESGAPFLFQWQVPSHPEVGANLLAGNVAGLDELPADLPVFQGSGGALYRLYWHFSYEEYSRRCQLGPDSDGTFDCIAAGGTDLNNGHYEYEWRSHAESGEIHPAQIANLPAGYAVDLNGDGIPDAYWNSNLTLRRMDEANRVGSPLWARSWNWGGAIYWAVREGQGQIGWPGNP